MSEGVLWALFVPNTRGWCELESLAVPPGLSEPYRLALELGYGLAAVSMMPRITTHDKVMAGIAQGWTMAPLRQWWETYLAAAEGLELPKEWPSWPLWTQECKPLPRRFNDWPAHSAFDPAEFEGTRVVAELGEPPDSADEAGLACELCGLSAVARPNGADAGGLDWRDCQSGHHLLCQGCWRDHWRELRDVEGEHGFRVAVLKVREDDPRLWWEWGWDNDISIGTERGREQWSAWYRDGYLKSRAWSEQRHRLIRRANGRCEWCGQSQGKVGWLEGHHLDYKDVGHEDLEDLVLLCGGCHRAAHDEKDPTPPIAGRTYAERYYRIGRRRVAKRIAAQPSLPGTTNGDCPEPRGGPR